MVGEFGHRKIILDFDEFSKMACTFVFKLTLCDMLFLPLPHLSEPHDVLLRDYSTTEESRQPLTSLFKKMYTGLAQRCLEQC